MMTQSEANDPNESAGLHSYSDVELEEQLDFSRTLLGDLQREASSDLPSFDQSKITAIEDRIEGLERESERREKTKGHVDTSPSKLSSKTVMDERQWENYLQSRYNCLFDRSAVGLFHDTAKIGMSGSAASQIASQDLRSPLTKPNFPLEGLKLRGGASVHMGGRPPWQEDTSNGEFDDAYASAKGFKPLSVDLDLCLQEAVKLGKSTGEFRSINTWHIAFALLKVGPPGFVYFLQNDEHTLERAAEVLRSNARRNAPEIHRVLPWRQLEGEGIGMLQMPRLAEEDGILLWKFLNEMEVRPSYAVAKALEHAVAQCAQVANINRSAELRVEHVMAGLLTVGLQDELEKHASVSLPLAMANDAHLTADSIWSLWISLRDAAATKTKKAGWAFSSDVEGLLIHAQDLCDLCTEGDRWLASRHLVAAILIRGVAQPSYQQSIKIAKIDPGRLPTILIEHLKIYNHEDSQRAWRTCLAKVSGFRWIEPVRRIGSQLMLKREAEGHQLCLGINEYSSAIQEMFEAAPVENDFVFGLFAPWGRGKSTLIDSVAAKLHATHYSVKFGAAKYPSRPEVWVHLYQTVMRCAESSGFWDKWRMRIKVGILRTGWLPLIVGAFSASFSVVERLGWASSGLNWLFDGLGVLGILILGASAYRFFRYGKVIYKTYSHLPDHADKLGLQAVIGDDLDRLLRAWLPSKRKKGSDIKAWKKRLGEHFMHEDCAIDFRMGRVGWLCLMLCLFLIGCGSIKASMSLWDALSQQSTPEAGWSIWNWGLAAFLCGVYFLLLYGFWKIAVLDENSKRVLLVIDDLDRCEPEQALSVIESIRWFLDSPRVSSRLQVAMLMEKEALEAACKRRARKFGFLTDGTKWRERFQSHREKLFVLELELPALVLNETNELVSLAIATEEGNDSPEGADKIPSHLDSPKPASSTKMEGQVGANATGYEDEPVGGKSIEGQSNEEALKGEGEATPDSGNYQNSNHGRVIPDETGAGMVGTEDALRSSAPGHFTEEEREALMAAFGRINSDGLTPRSIRAAIVRYQFARRLLNGVPFEPVELMERLLNQMFGGPSQADSAAQNSAAMDRVISQLV